MSFFILCFTSAAVPSAAAIYCFVQKRRSDHKRDVVIQGLKKQVSDANDRDGKSAAMVLALEADVRLANENNDEMKRKMETLRSGYSALDKYVDTLEPMMCDAQGLCAELTILIDELRASEEISEDVIEALFQLVHELAQVKASHEAAQSGLEFLKKTWPDFAGAHRA
jgi:chromosome segregation ATPase